MDMLFVVKIDEYGIVFLGDGELKYTNRLLPLGKGENQITDTGNYEVVGNIHDNQKKEE